MNTPRSAKGYSWSRVSTSRIAIGVVLTSVVCLALGAAHATHAAGSPAGVNERMSVAARHFLASLAPELRARALRPFDDAARTELSNVPGPRAGIALAEMSDEQRAAARELMRSALSPKGVAKAEAVIAHDGLLRDIERAAGGTGAGRDPLAYTFAVFGEPPTGAHAKPWGWRLEGHHLSLNFTASAADATSVTPLFFGACPALVRSGPQAGVRILAAEEDLARELLDSLDATQRSSAVLSKDVPSELLNAPGRARKIAAPAGLAAGSMGSAQRAITERLIGEYLSSLDDELALREMARIRSAGIESLRFAWYGPTERGRPHCYAITGPTFSIEYDCTQDGGNHIHSVWHDRERDYGATPVAR